MRPRGKIDLQHSAQIHIQLCLKPRAWIILHTRRIADCAGVVQDNIDAAEAIQRLGDETPGIFFLADEAAEGESVAA